MPNLELVAVAVTLVAVYLTTRQVIWCWPLGMVSVTLYAIVFYEAKLYADMGLQGFYFALSVYGWWAWLHGGEDRSELRVSRAGWRLGLGALLVGAAFAALLGTLLARLTDASLPHLDSALTSFSLVAQFLATRKLLENWLLWIAVDVVYVGMFIYKGLYPTAALYAAFLVLAAVGFARWRRSMTAEEAFLETVAA
jgi:nicotinamide mononucleotide transporter